METTSLKAIKKGDYFKTINSKLIPSKTIYVKGDYIPSLKKYEIFKFNDINDLSYLQGNKTVTTDFIF